MKAHSASTFDLRLSTFDHRQPPTPSPQPPRGRRPRKGIVLLLVVSLLALFVLLGATFTVIALHALNASKYELKIQQTLDAPDTEMDLIMGQILYDTQARTVLQYHSLLRDLYGYDADNFLQPVNYNPVPQFREAFQGTVIPTDLSPTTTPSTPAGTVASTYMPVNAAVPSAIPGGGQLFSFLFALPPFSNANPASLLPIDPITGGPRWHALTQLSTIPNYYVGRVITFTSGPAANHSARIVGYTPVSAVISGTPVFFNMHRPNTSPPLPAPTTLWNTNPASFFPAYGQFIIETIESKLNGVLTPNPGDSFVVNGAPFNGAGAGYDPITGNIDAMLAHKQTGVQAAVTLGASLGTTYGYNPASNPSPPAPNEYVALLPNYAAYESGNAANNPGNAVVFDWQSQFDALPVTPSHPAGPEWINVGTLSGNKARAPNTIDIGGMDESWDAPDFQNMFLAMVPPRAAEAYAVGIAAGDPTKYLPIIPSYHRPELLNYWVNWIIINIFENPALNHKLTRTTPPGYGFITPPGQPGQLNIIAQPYGPDGIRGTGDDPLVAGQGGTSLTIQELDRIYNIIHGCLMRPAPWDHPNFTGSNPNLSGNPAQVLLNFINGSGPTQPLTNLTPLVAYPTNLLAPFMNPLMWDVDNDSDGLPDAIWIDPGLPIVTMPNGKRAKRLAAITIKDLDGRINVNAHGNLAQVAGPPLLPVFPFSATIPGGPLGGGAATGLLPNMVSPGYVPPTLASYSYVGAGLTGQVYPRGVGFGPAEVDFSNIIVVPGVPLATANAYRSLLTARYASGRVNTPFVNATGTVSAGVSIADSLAFDPPIGSPGAILGTGAPFATPGIPYFRDVLSAIKHNGVPNDYANYLGITPSSAPQLRLQPSCYASPPDVWGRGAVLMDVGGQPLMLFMGQGPQTAATPNAVPNLGEMVDSPYEMRLSGEDDGADSPYTAAELERVLRYHDPDSTQLSQRLLIAPMLTGAAPANPLATAVPGVIDASHRRREMLTSMSSHIPTPATRMPQEARVNANLNSPNIPGMPTVGSTSILDLYRAKLLAAGVAPAMVNTVMQQIVPWEFFKGQKFDLNRWLGDGVDNDGDGVRDDQSDSTASAAGAIPPGYFPEYAFAQDPIVPLNHPPAGFVGVPPAYPIGISSTPVSPATTAVLTQTTTGPNIFANGYWAKQIYARHLFCLAMLFLPDDPSGVEPVTSAIGIGGGATSNFYVPNFTYDSDSSTRAKARKVLIRRIAQWAINCVDFRDPDAVMTPFEFDYNPWDGWNVDGFVGGISPGPNGVWGTPLPDSDDVYSLDDTSIYRGLVWGMEAPDLMITETLALHDRGLKDTATGNGMTQKVTSSPPQNDADLDQFRVPKGSLFVELYCPRPKTWPGELANNKPGVGGIGLTARAPNAAGVLSSGYPRWRLAFSRLNRTETANPTTLALANPESMTVEPLRWNPTMGTWVAEMSMVEPTVNRLIVDRFAYFTDVSGSGLLPDNERNASFFNTIATSDIQPGQYAVVGPRPVTYLGSLDPTSPSNTVAGSLWGGNSSQYIRLIPGTPATNAVVVKDTSDQVRSRSALPAPTADMQQPIAIVCDTLNPGYPTGNPDYWKVGLNISEPMPTNFPTADPSTYYLCGPGITVKPSDPSTSTLAAGPASRATNADFYNDPDTATTGYRDQPLEQSGSSTYPIGGSSAKYPGPGMLASGTYQDASTVLLQRLADPSSPYNPTPYATDGSPDPNYNPRLPVNPYITLDWQTIDLNVFTGEENATASAFSAEASGIYYNDSVVPFYFRSRQRGFLVNSGSGYYLSSNPWPPLTLNGPPLAPAPTTWKTTLTVAPGGPYFTLNLSSNDTFSGTTSPALSGYAGYQTTNTFSIANWRQSLGSINSTVDFPIPNGIPSGVNTQYYGEPITPFPWLNWNNRPFSNAMELLSVPASPSSRAFLEMTPDFPVGVSAGTPTAPTSPYADFTSLGPPYVPPSPLHMHWPFGHLLNLFHGYPIDTSSSPNPTPATPSFPNAPTSSIRSPHLYRLLDYVEVPSPFSGAERWYQPASFLGLAAGNFQPPYNKLSRFRDPGRVNLNTIFDFVDADLSNPALGSMGQPECIWDAVVGQFYGLRRADGFLNRLILSRQGDGGSAYVMNSLYPTRFANPFRATDSSDLMPNVATMRNPAGTTANFPVSATLLRNDPLLTTTIQPLFQINPAINATSLPYTQWFDATNNTTNAPNYLPGRFNMPAIVGSAANAHDINRNPYFRYQALQKIGNTVTTNSNCFAVWITIGYFEVEENFVIPAGSQQGGSVVYDAAHPDGFRLGQEIGIDSGDVTRHRGFYIVDRSIPVGFVPGSRLNTDDCILVRRLIE